jgi:hypothetical protein
MFAMADTDRSTSADEPGIVIRNEDVFLRRFGAGRVAEATGHLLSPVLLLQTGRGTELHAALEAATEVAGPPVVSDVDHVGRTHAIWPVAHDAARELLELAGGGELVVADGNHRSLAAQTGGLRRFLAVITTASSVDIQPYHRLVSNPVPLTDRSIASSLRARARRRWSASTAGLIVIGARTGRLVRRPRRVICR